MGKKATYDLWLKNIEQDDIEAMWKAYNIAKTSLKNYNKLCKIAMITSCDNKHGMIAFDAGMRQVTQIFKDICVVSGNNEQELKECIFHMYRGTDRRPILSYFTEKKENLIKFINAKRPADILAKE